MIPIINLVCSFQVHPVGFHGFLWRNSGLFRGISLRLLEECSGSNSIFSKVPNQRTNLSKYSVKQSNYGSKKNLLCYQKIKSQRTFTLCPSTVP